MQVKEYATTSLQKLAQTFAPIALASIHKLHQMSGVDSGTHLHTAMLNASISILNVLIRATNEAVEMFCDDDAHVTHVAGLPLLKSKERWVFVVENLGAIQLTPTPKRITPDCAHRVAG